MSIPSRVKKLVKSLQLKKYRKEEQCFVVEGARSVEELLGSDFEIVLLTATSDFMMQYEKRWRRPKIEIIESSESELSSMGSLQTNNTALAVARMKPNDRPTLQKDQCGLVLDNIRDPGNVGTIIRTADWYGVNTIVASEETADFYNPKTISATMGSFCRVSMFYTSLEDYLPGIPKIYGAFLTGTDVHQVSFEPGVIVIGNESNGISPQVERLVHQKITIPAYGKAESLNAGVATAVILDNLRRSQK